MSYLPQLKSKKCLVCHNIEFSIHKNYFIFRLEVWNVHFVLPHPAEQMTSLYQEQVYSPVFVSTALHSLERQTWLQNFIAKVQCSLE